MKRSLIALMALVPLLAFGGPNDLVVNQRNAADNGTIPRTVAKPAIDGVFAFNTATQLPVFFALGPSFTLSNGILNVPVTTGATGPAGSNGVSPILSIGSVSTGATSAATLTGTQAAPVLNLTLQKGDTGATGATGAVSTVAGPAGPTGGTGPAGPAGPPFLPTGQSSPARTLNSAFQVSTSKWSHVKYAVMQTVTASIAGGQNGDAVLEIATNSAFTTGVQSVDVNGFGQTYTLAVAIQGVQPQTTSVSGWVPPGYFVRVRTVSNTGTPAFSIRAGGTQEVIF